MTKDSELNDMKDSPNLICSSFLHECDFDTFLVHCVLKKGDALLPLLSNFALEYIIRNVQEN